MSLIVLYFLHSTSVPVLSFYIDVVLILSIGFRFRWRCQLRWHGLVLRWIWCQHSAYSVPCQACLTCEKFELVLQGCWRSTQRCVNELVCCQNSLCYIGTVGQRSLEQWLHVPCYLVFENFISGDQWPDLLQEIISVITTRVKPTQRSPNDLVEDFILSFRYHLLIPLLTHVNALIYVYW